MPEIGCIYSKGISTHFPRVYEESLLKAGAVYARLRKIHKRGQPALKLWTRTLEAILYPSMMRRCKSEDPVGSQVGIKMAMGQQNWTSKEICRNRLYAWSDKPLLRLDLSTPVYLCLLALLERLSNRVAALTSGSNFPVSFSSGVSSRASGASRPPLSLTQLIHLSQRPSEDRVSGAPSTTKPLQRQKLWVPCKLPERTGLASGVGILGTAKRLIQQYKTPYKIMTNGPEQGDQRFQPGQKHNCYATAINWPMI